MFLWERYSQKIPVSAKRVVSNLETVLGCNTKYGMCPAYEAWGSFSPTARALDDLPHPIWTINVFRKGVYIK